MVPQEAELVRVNMGLVALARTMARQIQKLTGEKGDLLKEIEAHADKFRLLSNEYFEMRKRKDGLIDDLQWQVAELTEEVAELCDLNAKYADALGKRRDFNLEQRRSARWQYQEQVDQEAREGQLIRIQDTQECPNPQCGGQHLILGRDDVCTCGYCGAKFQLDMPRPGDPF